MKFLSLIFIFSFCLMANNAFAETSEKTTMGASGYPLPRFMSLDDPKTNMRTGPGLEYPIDWIYNKEDYPLRVIAEHGNWRKVVDVDGATGWILRSLLSLSRKAMIINGSQKLVKSPEENDKVTLIAEEDVIGTIEQCQQEWCEMEISGFKGWINHQNIWGVLDQETFD
jgi:SH3-like domain-containing protein